MATSVSRGSSAYAQLLAAGGTNLPDDPLPQNMQMKIYHSRRLFRVPHARDCLGTYAPRRDIPSAFRRRAPHPPLTAAIDVWALSVTYTHGAVADRRAWTVELWPSCATTRRGCRRRATRLCRARREPTTRGGGSERECCGTGQAGASARNWGRPPHVSSTSTGSLSSQRAGARNVQQGPEVRTRNAAATPARASLASPSTSAQWFDRGDEALARAQGLRRDSARGGNQGRCAR